MTKQPKPRCYNCKHASKGFKIGDITNHQCNHPKHEEGFNNGMLFAFDTLMYWHDTCESHEYKIKNNNNDTDSETD